MAVEHREGSTRPVILITGASAGVGEALARELARDRRASAMVLTARRVERLDRLADELRTLDPELRVATIPADLADPAAPGRLAQEAVSRFGGIDVLINNAGLGLPKQFAAAEPDQIARQIAVNFTAPLLLTRHCLASLIPRRGMIINIGSAITCVANSALGAYGATKAGLAYWNDALRRELKSTGVRVCLVEPGPIKTEFMDAIDSMVPAGGQADPILDNAAPWMTAEVTEVARRVARLLDHPRRRLSVLRRLVWPFRALGAVSSLFPPLGDRVVVALSPAALLADDRGGCPMSLARTRDFLELIKFSHTLFALPFALLGAALAAFYPGAPPPRLQDWLGILLCMAAARSAAMAFNRLADRSYDALNPRTAARHLPAGRLSARSVALFTATAAAAFVASTLLFLPNRWPLYLSVPVLLWLLGYSYSKRFTMLAHFWLGLSLSLAPIAAWIALRGDIAWPPIFLAEAVLFWVAGFDIIYACQDVDFDQRAGLRSIPRRLGIRNALRVAAACHALMIVPLIILGFIYPLGFVYFAGVAAVAALLVYEHALVRPDDLTRVNVAFFQVNIVISMGLLAVAVIDLLVKRFGPG